MIYSKNKISLLQFISTIAFLVIANVVFGQLTEKASFGSFLLKNAELHTVTEGIVAGDLLIQGNKIVQIGESIEDEKATVIDCSGKKVFPGFMDGGTGLGLQEIESISLTRDYHELGNYNPQAKALTAINPNSVLIPVTRVNGVTTVVSKPRGGTFPGTAAIINLWGYTPSQMSTGVESVVLEFPRTGKRSRWDRRSKEEIEKQSKEKMAELDLFWSKSVSYHELHSKNNGAVGYNPELEAMRNVLDRNQKLMIVVNQKQDILKAIEWVKDKNVDVVFSGVSEGYFVADSIAKANIPAIVGYIIKNPSGSFKRFDLQYKNASILHSAGVKVAIMTGENENVRNLPYHAGFTAAYGLGKEEAIKAITINFAEIFGLEKDYGSLTEGKRANLFICDGDPFEPKTKIEQVFINGYKIPMQSRHSQLYDEFLERYPGVE